MVKARGIPISAFTLSTNIYFPYIAQPRDWYNCTVGRTRRVSQPFEKCFSHLPPRGGWPEGWCKNCRYTRTRVSVSGNPSVSCREMKTRICYANLFYLRPQWFVFSAGRPVVTTGARTNIYRGDHGDHPSLWWGLYSAELYHLATRVWWEFWFLSESFYLSVLYTFLLIHKTVHHI